MTSGRHKALAASTSRMRASTRSMTSSGVEVPAVSPTTVRGLEPFGADVRVGLDVVHAGAVARAGLHQLARVVAGPAADHDDDVRLTRHLDGRGLPVLGGLAHGVDEAHLRLRESLADQRDQVPHPLDRLRRLSGHAEPWMLLEREDVVVVQHDVEPVEVAGEAAHLHMVPLPDDDHVVASRGRGPRRRGGRRARAGRWLRRPSGRARGCWRGSARTCRGPSPSRSWS